MEQKKLYVVTTVRKDEDGYEETQCVAAFDTEREAKGFIDQQANPCLYIIQDVSYGAPFEEKPVLWNAMLKTACGFAHIQTDREDEYFARECEYCVGMVRVMYGTLNIWFLAKNQSEADEFAERMIRSILDREQAGLFKWLRKPVFQTNPDDVTSIVTPYYDFQTGQLILPEVGHFILPEELMQKKYFRPVSGKGPYGADPGIKPLHYYNTTDKAEAQKEE